MPKTKLKKIGITTLGVIPVTAIPTSIVAIIEAKETRKQEIKKEDIITQDIKDKIKDIENQLKTKLDKAVMISLIAQLETFLQNPNDPATITIVRAVLAALKSQLQTTLKG